MNDVKPRPYHLNLVANDRVLVVSMQRQGKVKTTPARPDTQRKVAIILDGSNSPRYFDILDLRMMDKNEPEAEPPMDGFPPEETERPPAPSASVGSALEVITAEIAAKKAWMEEITHEFKGLQVDVTRLDRARVALTAPVE